MIHTSVAILFRMLSILVSFVSFASIIWSAAVIYRFARLGLRIKENKEVYEGEVTELTPEET